MTAELEVIADDGNLVGEGPIWDGERNRLLWTDISSSLVYQMDAAGTKSIINRDLVVNGIGLNGDGRLVFSGAGGLFLWSGEGEHRNIASEHEGEALSFNDMIVGPQGRVYAGTMYWGENGKERDGKLYKFGPSGVVEVVAEGIELSNGLGFSPDDGTLYHSDSAARRIYAFDVDAATGRLENRRVFVQVPGDEGIPDGMTVDAEGFVWSAQWYGEQVVRYDPDGSVERRLPMPVKQVSAVAFGGPDLDELYITSAGASWPSDVAPPGYDFAAPNMGGTLFRLRAEVRGKPEFRAAFE